MFFLRLSCIIEREIGMGGNILRNNNLVQCVCCISCLKFSEETVVPLQLLQNIMFQCGYCELIFNDHDSMAAHEKGHERNIDDEDLNSARYFLKILTMVKGRKI